MASLIPEILPVASIGNAVLGPNPFTLVNFKNKAFSSNDLNPYNTFNHELLHMASSSHSNEEYHIGFYQITNKANISYALNEGYSYLELPYWTFKDNTYQTLIDNKIIKLLEEPKQGSFLF